MSGQPRLRRVPVTRDQALAFIAAVHRHHGRPHGYRFAVGVAAGDTLVGVATAGRPSARELDNGLTVEVTRVTTDGTPNACSALYGACWDTAKAMGYSRAVTYTQAGESGASLRGAGWLKVADLRARPGWDMPSRRRDNGDYTSTARHRWQITASTGLPLPALGWREPAGDDAGLLPLFGGPTEVLA